MLLKYEFRISCLKGMMLPAGKRKIRIDFPRFRGSAPPSFRLTGVTCAWTS